MSQLSIIKDPGGGDIVRVISDIQPANGSIIKVPADTVAFFVLNGEVSEPYGPGDHVINTGINPFFRRLSNIMTGGIPVPNVAVFFVSPHVTRFLTIAVSDILFVENSLSPMHMQAKGSVVVGFSIENPKHLISALAGMQTSESITTEDIEPAIRCRIVPAIKETIAREINNTDIINLNNDLVAIGRNLTRDLNNEFNVYGLKLISCNVQGININPEDIQKLKELEISRAKGELEIGLEASELNKIYNGEVIWRIIEGALTSTVRGKGEPINNNNNMTQNLGQMGLLFLLVQQFAPMLSDKLGNVFHGTNPLTTPTSTTPNVNSGGYQTYSSNYQQASRKTVLGKYCAKCGANTGNRLVCPVCKARLV